MKALQISPEFELKYLDVTKPTPQPDEALVKIKAAGLNPSDILNAKGSFPLTTFPRIPGRDFAGVVEEGPAEWKGKRVFGTSGNQLSFSKDGVHAEYATIPVGALIEIPDYLSFNQAATLGVPYATAAYLLQLTKVTDKDTVLILGANGSVGSSAANLAREKGAKVLAAARNDPNADVDTSSDPDLKTLAEKGGFDVVLDTVGAPQLTVAAIEQSRVNGRCATIAAPRQGSTSITLDMLKFYRNGLTFLGGNTLKFTAAESAAILRPLVTAAAHNAVPDDQITAVPLEKAVELYQGKPGKGKTVIVME